MKKIILAVSVVIFLLALQPAEASFPTRPITVINASVAGSATDVMARQIAHYAEAHLDQPFVIINRPGGAGAVTFSALLAEDPDGYTIVSSNASQLAILHTTLRDQFSFDDFIFLANVQVDNFAFFVLYDSPFHSISDVVEAARGGQDLLVAVGGGVGSGFHLAGLQLAHVAGIDLTLMPTAGGGEANVQLLGAHVDLAIISPASSWAHVEAGQMRFLGLAAEERSPLFPDVPTVREQGYDVVASQWRGFIARRGMPQEIQETIVEAIRLAAHEEGFQEFLAQTKVGFGYVELDEFARFAREDFDRVGEIMSLLEN